jgi:hypothetical protein
MPLEDLFKSPSLTASCLWEERSGGDAEFYRDVCEGVGWNPLPPPLQVRDRNALQTNCVRQLLLGHARTVMSFFARLANPTAHLGVKRRNPVVRHKSIILDPGRRCQCSKLFAIPTSTEWAELFVDIGKSGAYP